MYKDAQKSLNDFYNGDAEKRMYQSGLAIDGMKSMAKNRK